MKKKKGKKKNEIFATQFRVYILYRVDEKCFHILVGINFLSRSKNTLKMIDYADKYNRSALATGY